jgi:hypothetical protein
MSEMKIYTKIFVVIILGAIILSCGTTKPNHTKFFNDDTLGKLVVGMSVVEFGDMFGAPDTSYNMVFGKYTDHQWNGLVYKYYGHRDPAYQFAKRYLTNTFVFCNDFGPAKLNHWKLEFRLNQVSE